MYNLCFMCCIYCKFLVNYLMVLKEFMGGNLLMENLSDALLIEAYYKTKEFNLESDFTKLIIDELKSRTIHFID
ncbi:hypothetical protein CFK37_17960 [Virgibacillus phasianinus]|uniref:Sporulation histidine kinase inhibitor Sda n=1 Tax=Virgibacillus phasianinus TaxID=2017483 RepID=A0A220U7N6_9BACI|nr:hypothetical protein CFK37_17960 [Virgibacillus phasianinus]